MTEIGEASKRIDGKGAEQYEKGLEVLYSYFND